MFWTIINPGWISCNLKKRRAIVLINPIEKSKLSTIDFFSCVDSVSAFRFATPNVMLPATLGFPRISSNILKSSAC